jgi:hypothetical protein
MAERRRRAAFATALVCGAGIWLLSPLVTGRAEPWDAAGWYYPGALFLAGCAVALLFPAHPGVVAIGIVAGQILVLLGRVAADPSGGGLGRWGSCSWWATAWFRFLVRPWGPWPAANGRATITRMRPNRRMQPTGTGLGACS